MSDEMFGRMWEEGHARFSASVDRQVGRVAWGLKLRLARLPDPALHGLLMVAAVAASLSTLLLASPAGAAALS